MTILSRSDLYSRRFPEDRVEALFQAVLIDDDVDDFTQLPARITLDHDEALLADGFRICHQLLVDGVDIAALRSLLSKLERDRDLDAADRLGFKHMRAKLKHFRFACALYGSEHRYPTLIDWFTTALGHLQDAFKTGQAGRVLHKAWVANLFLSRAAWPLLERERDRLRLTSSADFRDYLRKQVIHLAALLERPTVTGAEFHAGRKVASRQVAFYDNVRTIRFSDEAYQMSRSLAAINGLMGNMHDQLIERRVAGVQDYHREQFALPAEIRNRIAALVDTYRTSGLF